MSTARNSTPATASMLLAEVGVVTVERPSPSFVRVVLGGEPLAHFGVDGPLVDQRIKLIFPSGAGGLPGFDEDDEHWYESWLAMPDEERGHMRTYTVREVRGSGTGTRLVVDLVLHGDPSEETDAGVGCAWAARVEPGDRIVVVAPRRGRPFGGREFDTGGAGDLLIAGDETAVPAIAGILRDLTPTSRGVVFAEVPDVADVVLMPAPVGVDVRWLPRSGDPVGTRLVPAVRRHLGLEERPDDASVPPERKDDVWETPSHSVTGEDLPAAVGTPSVARYAWIAGESAVVRTLRRTLVGELGWDRREVCFMGYWRIGVAMRA